jgi:hypothetical protein
MGATAAGCWRLGGNRGMGAAGRRLGASLLDLWGPGLGLAIAIY